MRWRINGADRETAQSREVWLEAQSQDQARQIASEMGIVVSSALQDEPVIINTPKEIQLSKKQLRVLKVSEMKIASGVALGLFLYSFICFMIFLIFVVFGIGSIASNY